MLKRFLFFIFAAFIVFMAHADNIDIDWIIDGETYTSTTCTYGGDVTLPNTPSKTGYTFVGWQIDYTPVEYLGSNGTQWIDTGYIPTSLTRTEIDLKFSSTTVGGSGIIFGVTGPVGAYQMNFGSDGTTLYNWLCQYQVSSNCGVYPINSSGPQQIRSTMILDSKNKIASYGEKTVNLNQTVSLPSGTIYIFAGHEIDKNYTEFARIHNLYTSMFVYSVKIYDDDILVRDFIPVLDPNGVACMYDKITQTFFYNQGTGDFVVGPEINE